MVPVTSAFILALAVCLGYRASAVRILEDPVLLDYNSTYTALRCSIEVGAISPRIDFYFNGVSLLAQSAQRCNGAFIYPFVHENSLVADQCVKNTTVRVRHQVVFVRTCFGDTAYTSWLANMVIQCKPHSASVNLSVASHRVVLTYNDLHQPRLDPETVPVESLRVPQAPICPQEPVGTLNLQSSTASSISSTAIRKGLISTSSEIVSTSANIVTPTSSASHEISLGSSTSESLSSFPSGQGATPTELATTPTPSSTVTADPSVRISSSLTPSLAPSVSPTIGPTKSGDFLSTLTEAELRLIIFIAAGVAAVFAIIVVCLLCVLCCILARRRKSGSYNRAHKQPREGLTKDDSKKETIRLERLERNSTSPNTSDHAREPQQFALHRGSSGSTTSNANSINSDTLGRDHRPSVEVTTGSISVARQTSIRSVTVTEAVVTATVPEGATGEHDYDYIDDSKFSNRPSAKKAIPAVPSTVPTGSRNLKVAVTVEGEYSVPSVESKYSVPSVEGEYSVPSVEGQYSVPSEGEYKVPRKHTSSAELERVPEFPVTDSLRRECGVELSQEVAADTQKPSDYVNQPTVATHDYQNSPTINPETSEYQNRDVMQCGTQTDLSISDSYQELNTISSEDLTVDDSSSASYFNHLQGFTRPAADITGTSSSSCFEEVPKELDRRMQSGTEPRMVGDDRVYHTIFPSGTDSSDSSCSTGNYCLPPDIQAKIKAKALQERSYNEPSRLRHKQQSKTAPQMSSSKDHDYEDLDAETMDNVQDYSTLEQTTHTASISTQTYA